MGLGSFKGSDAGRSEGARQLGAGASLKASGTGKEAGGSEQSRGTSGRPLAHLGQPQLTALYLTDSTAKVQEARVLGPPRCIYPVVGAARGRGFEDRGEWRMNSRDAYQAPVFGTGDMMINKIDKNSALMDSEFSRKERFTNT